MPKMKAAKLAAVGKMKGLFAKNKFAKNAGDEAEAKHGPLEEAKECNCGMPGCPDCAKATLKNK
jgi:hypothetical protein